MIIIDEYIKKGIVIDAEFIYKIKYRIASNVWFSFFDEGLLWIEYVVDVLESLSVFKNLFLMYFILEKRSYSYIISLYVHIF